MGLFAMVSARLCSTASNRYFSRIKCSFQVGTVTEAAGDDTACIHVHVVTSSILTEADQHFR